MSMNHIKLLGVKIKEIESVLRAIIESLPKDVYGPIEVNFDALGESIKTLKRIEADEKEFKKTTAELIGINGIRTLRMLKRDLGMENLLTPEIGIFIDEQVQYRIDTLERSGIIKGAV